MNPAETTKSGSTEATAATILSFQALRFVSIGTTAVRMPAFFARCRAGQI